MKHYQSVKLSNFKLYKHENLDLEWLNKLVLSLHRLPAVAYAPNRSRAYVPLSKDCNSNSAFVKLYAHTDYQSRGLRRTNPLRRLLSRYAAKEAHAYLNFRQLGLAVPKVLAFGEEWKFMVRHRGLFVVEALQGLSIQHLLHETRNTQWVERIFTTISRIHRAGVTHGDAHLVNFIGTEDEIYAIDIDKSKPVTEKGKATDLVNIAAGILLEIDDLDNISRGLELYQKTGLSMPLQKDELITIARKKNQHFSEADRVRYYGSTPKIKV